MRQEFVNTAISFLGCKESDGSHKPIIDLYNQIKPLPQGYKLKYTDAWCAGFVSAVAQKIGITDIVFPECGCDRMIALYKKAGRWEENDSYVPSPGDLIFYDWQDSGAGDNTGSSDHVGIVVSVSGSKIKVIEGNMSDAVGYRTIAVNAKYIRGFALPNFDGKASPTTETPINNNSASNSTTQNAKTCTIKLNELRKGDKGALVKTAQLLLIGKGYSCGWTGADGDFGALTETAVKSFQRAKKLTVDGIIGINTWTALLCA